MSSRWLDWKIVTEELPDEDDEVIAADIDGNFMIGRVQKAHDASVTGYSCYADDAWLDDVMAWTETPPFYQPEVYKIWRASVRAEN